MSISVQRVSPFRTIALGASFDRTCQKAGEVFAERGFNQVGMRELAKHLGIASGSIYHHIESKQGLLRDLIEDLYQTLLAGNQRKTRRAMTAQQRLRQLLEWHIELHSCKSAQLLLAEREVHCLTGENRNQIVELRDQYEGDMTALLAEAGGIDVSPVLRAFAGSTVSLLNNLPIWLQGSQLTVDGQRHFVLSLVEGFISTALNNLREHTSTSPIDNIDMDPLASRHWNPANINAAPC